MTKSDLPTVRKFRVRAVNAPLVPPHRSASGLLHVAPLVLLDIETDGGVTGSAYAFGYHPFVLGALARQVADLEELVAGQPIAPRDATELLRARTRLVGAEGTLGMAMAAIDMALWDALAKLRGLPLATLLGAAPRPVRVYDSLGMMSPDETARDIERSLAAGFRAFKVKAGHPDPATDLAVARAVRDVAGADSWLAMDFNQAFPVTESVRRMRLLEEENIAWIEEPVLADDLVGHATVRASISTPVQTGENWTGVRDMEKAVAAGAMDFAMPDVAKIGGVTGWLEAAGLAAAHRIPVSSHLFIEFSSHLLPATPTAHMLEWFDIAAGIRLGGPTVADGMARAADGPGAGIVWDEAAVAKYAA